jgi:GT2 family glycosyltransferase
MESLFQQTMLPEIIVVDNSSSDGSREYLENNYRDGQLLPDGRTLSFKLIEMDKNTGFCHAVNVGIKASATEFVFLLNNDTTLDQYAVEKLYHTMCRHERAFSVAAKMLSMNANHLIDDCGDYYCALGWAFTPGKDKGSNEYNRKAYITAACGGAAMYRKMCFETVGYFDEAHFCYLEDMDIGYRARIYGYDNIYDPEAIVYHAGSASSGSRYNEFKQRLTAANNLYLIYKNFTVLQIILNLPLIIMGILIKAVYFEKRHLGKAYVQGLLEGFSRIIRYHDRKVPFRMTHIPAYVRLQAELWVNCIRRVSE